MKRICTLHRRHFLSAMGLGWLASNHFGLSLSHASETPLRFVSVYTPHGVVRDLYRPRSGFDISYPDCVLAPFDDPATYGRRFKDQLRVLDGIDLAAGIEVGTVAHDAARVILTGSGATGTNASLDQALAVGYGLGQSTPLASLTLAVGSADLRIGFCISYANGGTPVPKWIDPVAAFEHVFGDGALGAGAGQERRELRRSVLDFIDGDLQSLARRLPAHERLKLEQHQTALRELEKRLEPAPESCHSGPIPAPLSPVGPGGERNFDRITDLMEDLVALAFGCDVTRFATLMLADLSHTGLFPDLPADIHSDVAHRYDERARPRDGAGLPASWPALARQNRYSYGKVARLLSRLDAAGVLDDTIVHVSSDMGDPARHSSRDVPTLIAGGAKGHFGAGRFIDLRCESSGCAPSELRPNNRLLVSILRAFGVEADAFGHAHDPAIVTGRLDELGS